MHYVGYVTETYQNTEHRWCVYIKRTMTIAQANGRVDFNVLTAYISQSELVGILALARLSLNAGLISTV